MTLRLRPAPSSPDRHGTAQPPPRIRVRGLRKRYGDTWAVDGLDLDVAEGEIVGLLGANGAGKTTTLEMLCALRRPTEGDIEVAGADPATRPRVVRARVGTVLQAPALDAADTPREVLGLQARLRGVAAGAVAGVVEAALVRSGIADLADARIGTLSGGQRRRVDLATAVIGRPEVLILDEPTAGLDPASRRALWDHVRELAASGLAVLLSTQDLHEAEQLAHRLVVLRSGRVVADATAAQLRVAAGGRSFLVTLADSGDRALALRLAADGGYAASDRSGDAGVRLPAGATVPLAYLAALRDAGVAVAGVGVDEPSLDDAVSALIA